MKMKILVAVVALVMVAFLALHTPAAVASGSHKHNSRDGHDHGHHHGAHLHGLAELDLVLEGQVLEIELHSPAANMVGFEHFPATGEQRRAVSDALALLRDGAQLFHLPAAARCRQVRAEVDTDLAGEADHGREHADFSAHWYFHCEHPEHLDRIDVQIFQYFPATQRIRVQAITPRGQAGADLTSASPRLNL